MATFSAVAASPDDPAALQQVTVTGKVTDAATGEALIGVTVLVKGTTTGALTDINGSFSIPVSDRQPVTLVVSFIGYTAQEVLVTPGSPANVGMALEVTAIKEVIVVGYGTQKKESVVGAISQVNNASIMKSGTTSITNAIAGKLSGVLTIQQSGEPGNNTAEIIVRGQSSWNGSQPLVLVDGVERDFSLLDPNEVNTISVLKDASATAVFGAKGANGVIIVTTKRGIVGKPQLDFSFQAGIQTAARIPEHIDSYTTMSMLNVGRMNNQYFSELTPDNILEEYRNPSSPLNALKYPDVDWFDVCTEPFAPSYNTNFNVSGGTEFVKYFLSLGYQYAGDFFIAAKEGFIDNRYYSHQFNYRLNLDFTVTKSTQLALNVGGTLDSKNQPNSSPWRNLYSTGGARFPAYFPDWVLEEVPDLNYPDASGWRRAAPFGEYTGNPYTTMMQGDFRKRNGSRLFTDLILKQELNFITKGLSFNAKVSLSTYYRNLALQASNNYPTYIMYYDRIGTSLNPWVRSGETPEVFFQPPNSVSIGGLEGGYYNDLYYEASINYNRSFGKHTVTGLGLFNRQQQVDEAQFPYYNEGLVGRATYDFNSKYLLEVNIGYTGSERFSPENRFGFFPSAAIGWVVSEEQFFKTALPWMNRFKIRYSDGLVGSDNASARWLYISDYRKDRAGKISEDAAPNLYAQWEEAHKRDLGFEFGIFKNTFTLNIDLFDEQRYNMLLRPRSVPMMIGRKYKDMNLGEVKKHGIEIEAEFRKKLANDLEYHIRGIFGWSENRVVFRDDPESLPEHMKFAGKPLTEMLSSEYGWDGLEFNGAVLTGGGYYTSIDDIHNNPSPIDIPKMVVGDYKFLDYTADGTINILDKYPIKGLTYPPITYSFSGGITWKGFDFNLLFQGNIGKYVQFNQTYEVEFIKGDWRVHTSQLDYWRPDNQNVNHSTLHYAGSGSSEILFWGGGEADRGYQVMIENRFFRNADYLRLKDLYLGYTFKPGYLKNIFGISSLAVYGSGNNLLTFTKLIEGDPERKDFQQGFYPQMKTFKLGVKVVF